MNHLDEKTGFVHAEGITMTAIVWNPSVYVSGDVTLIVLVTISVCPLSCEGPYEYTVAVAPAAKPLSVREAVCEATALLLMMRMAKAPPCWCTAYAPRSGFVLGRLTTFGRARSV